MAFVTPPEWRRIYYRPSFHEEYGLCHLIEAPIAGETPVVSMLTYFRSPAIPGSPKPSVVFDMAGAIKLHTIPSIFPKSPLWPGGIFA